MSRKIQKPTKSDGCIWKQNIEISMRLKINQGPNNKGWKRQQNWSKRIVTQHVSKRSMKRPPRKGNVRNYNETDEDRHEHRCVTLESRLHRLREVINKRALWSINIKNGKEDSGI